MTYKYITPLGEIFADTWNEGAVAAKFQIYVRERFGISDEDSLAFLLVNKSNWSDYFDDEIDMLMRAASVEKILRANFVQFPLNLNV